MIYFEAVLNLEPPHFIMAYSDRYLLFFEYFNKAKYMSAQTTLDKVWIDVEGEEKNFYGGLIQIAVSLFHLTNENPRGGQKIYEKAKEMLLPYGEVHEGVSLHKLFQDMDLLFGEKVDYEDPSLDYSSVLPKIEFASEGS